MSAHIAEFGACVKLEEREVSCSKMHALKLEIKGLEACSIEAALKTKHLART